MLAAREVTGRAGPSRLPPRDARLPRDLRRRRHAERDPGRAPNEELAVEGAPAHGSRTVRWRTATRRTAPRSTRPRTAPRTAAGGTPPRRSTSGSCSTSSPPLRKGQLHAAACASSGRGDGGRIADTVNEVMDVEPAHRARARAARAPGRQGRAHRRTAPPSSDLAGLVGRRARVGEHARRPTWSRRPTRWRASSAPSRGRPLADDGARDRRPPAPGRVPPHRARPSTRWSISSARSPPR